MHHEEHEASTTKITKNTKKKSRDRLLRALRVLRGCLEKNFVLFVSFVVHPFVSFVVTRRRALRGLQAREQGFSMMELLIGVSLTLVILATTVGALTDGIRTSDTARLVSQMQHNGRTGLNLMTRDLIQAGQGIPMGGIPIPSGAGIAAIRRPGMANLTFPAGSIVLPAISAGQALGPTIQGRLTDIITILYADSTLALDATPLAAIAADGSSMTVAAGTVINNPSNAVVAGDLIIFSNAIGNAIQEVTAVSATTNVVTFSTTDTMRFNQRTAPAGTIMQLQNGPGTYPPTTATRIWMITYYADVTNPSSPRLMRVVNNTQPRPVSLDIEDLQITYDLVDGFTNPAGVDQPVAPNSAAQIRKATVALLARSHSEQRTTGRFHYQTLRTQISFRSLSFIDRYQ
jgi:Tfp pilus assembly protein FimT